MSAHPLRGAAAIAGLGVTPQGKVYGTNAVGFAVDAVRLALDDAGLDPHRPRRAARESRPHLERPGHGIVPAPAGARAARSPTHRHHEPRRRHRQRDDPARRAGDRRRAVPHRRLRLLRRAAEAAVARGRRTSSGAAYGFARGWEAAYGFFGVNAMYALVARRHMHVYGTTQDQLGAIAVAQRRWANLNPQAQLHDRAAHARRLPRLALDRGAVPPLRLLPGVERRPRGDRHQRRARPRAAQAAGLRPGAWGRDISAAIRRHARLGRRPREGARVRDGGHHAARRRRRRALRLLHLHGARHARGLRLLHEGRGRSVRRRAPHRSRRQARAQHRRRPAVELLHVGHDAGVGGGDPAPRRGRRAPGRRSTTSRSCRATAASCRRTRRWCSRGWRRERDRVGRAVPPRPGDHARDGAVLRGRPAPRAGRRSAASTAAPSASRRARCAAAACPARAEWQPGDRAAVASSASS